MAEDYDSIGFKNKDIDRLRQIQQDTIKPKVTPADLARQKRAEVEKVAQSKRAEIVMKKDSIAQRCADAKGMTLNQYRSWSISNNKKPDAGLSNMGSGADDKKSACKAASKGDSTKRIR